MGEKRLRKPSAALTQILADNIREYRKVKHLSQEELADACELHRTYIGSVERGERNVTLSTLEVVAKALGVTVVELLTRNPREKVNVSSGVSRYVEAIRQRGLSIYDKLESSNSDCWIPTPALETILNEELSGISLAGLPIRTRSKVIKEHVCQCLGYPVPRSFKKTLPRFPGQLFDTYVQKSNNLQIWNEELVPSRRYVLIRVSGEGIITKVKVVTGESLALLDTTGTLTQKYQARLIPGTTTKELVTPEDTDWLRPFVRGGVNLRTIASPINHPRDGQLLPIAELFERLCPLLGITFSASGWDQERNRGASLHRLVCERLGYADYRDDGRFPDIRQQLLEVKLQTSPTIDLGLICPDSTDALDVPDIGGRQIRHCDVRYALFYAKRYKDDVLLTHLFLTTGEQLFSRFPKFQGRGLNTKLQLPLPADFFD